MHTVLNHTQAVEPDNFSASILNSLPANVAVLGLDGTIVATNEAWNRFARENGDPPLQKIGPNANYLDACRVAAAKGESYAQTALDGILSSCWGTVFFSNLSIRAPPLPNRAGS